MQHGREQLTLATRDSEFNLPDPKLIGMVYTHTGTSGRYLLTGFAWNGADDTWMAVMQETRVPNPVTIVRPLRHMNGLRQSGQGRYHFYADDQIKKA